MKISVIQPLNKGYIAYFSLLVLYGHISTSVLKSDVTIVYLNPNFLKDAKISVIYIHLRQI